MHTWSGHVHGSVSAGTGISIADTRTAYGRRGHLVVTITANLATGAFPRQILPRRAEIPSMAYKAGLYVKGSQGGLLRGRVRSCVTEIGSFALVTLKGRYGGGSSEL